MPQQRFYNATDKLVNAFIMDKLEHGYCQSCAVGNLCDGNIDWSFGSRTEQEEAISHTSYSLIEIANIEGAFEGSYRQTLGYATLKFKCIRKKDEDGFLGLCRVFDYLVSIEDWKEEESKVNLVELCLQNN